MNIQTGTALHYEWNSYGHQDTLVFIHALGSNLSIWDASSKILSKYFNTLALDLRGHGLSAHRFAPNGLYDYADDVLQLIDQLQLKSVIPVGLSIGGMIAMIMASKRSFPKIVLADTCYKIGDTSIWNTRIDLARTAGIGSFASMVVSRWFSTEYKSAHPEIVSQYQKILEQTSLDGYIQAVAALRDTDLLDILNQLYMPALCIVGEQDIPTRPDEVRSLANKLPNARFEIIADAAHMPCLDQTLRFSELILGFVGQG